MPRVLQTSSSAWAPELVGEKMLEIRLLGQFDVRRKGVQVQIASRPARRLLAYLVLNRGADLPREKLSGLLWPNSSEKNARKNLRQALWQLRSAIGDEHLVVDSESLAFAATADCWLDLSILEAASEEDLEAKLSVYEGELLPGFYEDWVLLERDRLTAVYERTIQCYLAQLEKDQRWADAVQWAERWIARGQVPEAAYRVLMHAHAALGDRSKVEAVYRRCCAALEDEVGVQPSEATTQLYEDIQTGQPDTIAHAPEGLRRPALSQPGPIHLPAERTAFVGREREIAAIVRLLTESRLLTIAGPGGIGKTRLAIKAAAVAASDFKHGCFFVPLARIGAVENLVQTIAEAVQFPTATYEDPQHQLLRYLQDRRLLLVLDNFEHLLEGTPLVTAILQAAPEVRILVTSREKLNLQSETTYILGGMGFPRGVEPEDQGQHDAASLFIQSARKVRSDFNPSPGEMEQIVDVCRTVGGMPLAIELAAAWLHILNVDDIARELEQSLDILSSGMRDSPRRHRSIRAVFDHSWSLLSPSEQDVLPALSVFRGGFTRDAARQVAGASLLLLADLVNKSFLSHDPSTGRLEMHELLRQYAQERLESMPDARRNVHESHADYYAFFMRQQLDALQGHQQLQALVEIDLDIENVRTAWRHSLEQKNAARIWNLIHGLWHVYRIRWWNLAGMELFADAVLVFQGQESEEAVSLRAMAMAFQAYFMAWLDQAQAGYDMARESVGILKNCDRSLEMVIAYISQTVNGYMLGCVGEEIDVIKQMMAIAEELGDRWLMAYTMFAASMLAMVDEEYAEARQLGHRNLELCDEMGDEIGSTMPMIILGHTALAEGDYAKARRWYLRCLQLAQEVEFHYSIQTSSKYLTKVALSQGDILEGERYLMMSLNITKDIGFVRDLLNLLYECARLRVAQRLPEKAVELLALVLQHPSSHQIRWFEGSIRDNARDLLTTLELELPQESFALAQERGRALELDRVVAALLGGAPD